MLVILPEFEPSGIDSQSRTQAIMLMHKYNRCWSSHFPSFTEKLHQGFIPPRYINQFNNNHVVYFILVLGHNENS